MDGVNCRALIFAVAVLAGVAAACGAGQRADDPQPTVSREARADRPSRLAAEAPSAERGQAVAVGRDAEAEGSAEAQSDQGEAAYVSGTIRSGWRAGVRAERNVLGDPDAEIVITEWSDYQ